MTRDALIAALIQLCGRNAVLHRPEELLAYDCDAFTLERSAPMLVVLPTSTEQVAGVVRLCHANGIPFVPRGAGTGLSGGCLSPAGGVMIALTRMTRIMDLDVRNRRATVEAGLVNLRLTHASTPDGLCYAPDPSSQMACTIGGNVAENSGGPHTLKYGVTTNHVLGLEVVLPDGEVVWLGGQTDDSPGYDLRGVMVGSEGTFGIVTQAVVRLVPIPPGVRTMLAVFDTVEAASEAVSSLIAAGVLPAALEMMDRTIIEAVEASFGLGLPTDAEAVLIVELDGLEAGLERAAQEAVAILNGRGAREVRLAKDEAERSRLWLARKKAVGCVGRLAPSKVTQDGVIPRSQLPRILRLISAIAARHQVRIANVFHAGDGNLHPIILFDEKDPEQVRRVWSAGQEILEACLDVGGSITGEHGIGVEKLDMMGRMFSEADMEVMRRVRDVFNPAGLCNPGKLLPTAKSCIETTRRPRPSEAAR